MRAFLICFDGRRFELGPLLRWTFRYGTGTPCDSFETECAWGLEMDGALSDAVEFEAAEGGETVFRGVVDEYECRWEKGGRLLVAGRGMAARLLDNEAVSADYQVATLEDILRDHVTPYGIAVAEKGNLPAVPGFSVESGCSEWQALYDFARYHGGVEPRFDRAGRLVLSPWRDGARLVVDDSVPVTAVAYREKRYGVLSEVLVRDRARKTVQRVADQDFLDRGGRCRRVFTMPGRSSYQAMRYSGEFQLARSREERVRLELTMPGAFLAWPGDIVEAARSRPQIKGIWRVLESETALGENGVFTRMTLGEG